MKKLTFKTFILLLALTITISVVAYVFIWFFLPYTNQNQGEKELNSDTAQLIEELRVTDKSNSELLFLDFIKNTDADISLLDTEENPVSFFSFEHINAEVVDGLRYPFRFANSKDEYILVVHYNNLRSEKIKKSILASVPFVAVITIVLSFIGAWLFSWYTTAPIVRINNIARKMANLDFSWYCPDMRDDEIGMLSNSINELSDELHSALDELHRRNSFLEDEIAIEKERERRRMLFFSGVSHELKTPIAIVIGQLEGMQAEIGVYKDRDKYLERSAEILQSLNNFIMEMLTISRIDIDGHEKMSPINMSDIISSLVYDYSLYADADSITMTSSIESNIFVYGDEILLKKALGNIIGNAITHSPDNATVHIQYARKNEMVELSVVNSPAHIDDEHLPHIFEAFYSTNQSSKYCSGLGLYITRMILETYNIAYNIENVSDGVKFTVLFKEASI